MGVPYYPQSRYTVNLGLSLYGMDEVLAENFVILDTSIGSGSGGSSTIKVNGSVVTNPNFNDTTPAAPLGFTNVLWQKDGSGNVSAYVSSASGGTPAPPFTSVQFNDAGAFGGNAGFTFNKVAQGVGIGPDSVAGGAGPIFGDPTNSFLDIEGTTTDITKKFIPLLVAAEARPTVDMAVQAHAAVFLLQTDSLTSHNYTSISGAQNLLLHNGSGTVNFAQGFVCILNNEGSGTITIARGGFAESLNDSATGSIVTAEGFTIFVGDDAGGTVTNAYGLHILSPSTTGMVSHYRGILIDDPTVGGANNPDPFAIYAAAGNSLFKGAVGVGNQAVAGGSGGIALNSSGISTLDVESNVSSIAHNTAAALFGLNMTNIADTAGAFYGSYSEAQIDPANINNFTGLVAGSFNEFDHYGSGTITRGDALHGEAYNQGSGTVTNLRGIFAEANSESNGTVTNAYAISCITGNEGGAGTVVNAHALHVYSPRTSAGGTLSHYVGIYLEDQAIDAPNNPDPYSIFSVGGKVFIGHADTGGVLLGGTSSGIISILTQAAAGTYNFNLPITAGSPGQVLTSQGGGATAMTWTTSTSTPSEVASVHLTAQTASIGTTTLYAVPSSGVYRVSYYVKITTAGSTSGSVTLTLGWTDRDDSTVLSVIVPTPANAVDTTGVVSGTLVVDAKTGTNITYLTTYASSGGTAMVYKLSLKAETL